MNMKVLNFHHGSSMVAYQFSSSVILSDLKFLTFHNSHIEDQIPASSFAIFFQMALAIWVDDLSFR